MKTYNDEFRKSQETLRKSQSMLMRQSSSTFQGVNSPYVDNYVLKQKPLQFPEYGSQKDLSDLDFNRVLLGGNTGIKKI